MRGRTWAAALLVTLSIVGFASPAQASGSGRFAWHADLSGSMTSRAWTSDRRADVGITSSLGPCVGPNPVRYRVELWRDRSWWRGPVRAGFRDFTCGGTAVFRGQRAGTYRFAILVVISTRGAGPFEADGVVAYGGARLRGAR